jgi:hypothetical protein
VGTLRSLSFAAMSLRLAAPGNSGAIGASKIAATEIVISFVSGGLLDLRQVSMTS